MHGCGLATTLTPCSRHSHLAWRLRYVGRVWRIAHWCHHHWQLEVTRTSDSERIVIQTGSWDIITDLDNNVDPRSHAEIMVDKIETVLQGRADADVLSYSINGRSLSKIPPQELVEWRDYYKREAAMEHRHDHIKNGKATSATVKVRF